MTVSCNTSKHVLSFPYEWTPVLTLENIAEAIAHVPGDLHIPEEIKKHLVGKDAASLLFFRACFEGTRCRRTNLPYYSPIRSLPVPLQISIVDSINEARNDAEIKTFLHMLSCTSLAQKDRFMNCFYGQEFCVHPRLAGYLARSLWRDHRFRWELGLKAIIEGHLMPLQEEYDRAMEADMLTKLCPGAYQVTGDRERKERAVGALAHAYTALLQSWPEMFDSVDNLKIMSHVSIERLFLMDNPVEYSLEHLERFGPKLCYLLLQIHSLWTPDEPEQVFERMCTLLESMTELKTLNADFLELDDDFALLFLRHVSRNSSITTLRVETFDRIDFPELKLCSEPANPEPFKSLHKLTLDQFGFSTETPSGFELPNLRELHLSRAMCNVNPAGFLNQFPSIEVLEISRESEFWLEDSGEVCFDGIWTEQLHLPQLKKLKLADINDWDDREKETECTKLIHCHVEEFLVRLPLLTKLILSEIDHFGVNKDRMTEFFKNVIPRMQNLNVLKFSGCQISEKGCKTLVENLQAGSASQLTSLGIRNAKLGASSMKHLVKLFPSTPLLEKLSIEDNGFTTAALIELSENFEHLPKLSVLDVTESYGYPELYTVPTFQQFCNNLKRLTNLKRFYLEYDFHFSKPKVPDELAGMLNEVVASLKSLTHLGVKPTFLENMALLS